jgi:predicted nucleotidyltransferase
MQKADAIDRLKQNADAIKGMGATALYLFESTVRDEAVQDSRRYSLGRCD